MIRLVFTVLCFLSVAFGDCLKADRYNGIATINKGYMPYWFQMFITECLQGDVIPEVSVFSLVLTGEINRNLRNMRITNFPVLKELFIDKNRLKVLPYLDNLPVIEIVVAANNQLTQIPGGSFSRIPVKEIFLSKNLITTIEAGAFGDNLTTIYLTCNNITILSPSWFSNPAAMKTLKLGGNRIMHIPDNMFKDFTNLEDLELRSNQIKTLGVGSISGPTNLTLLHLANNNITEIRGDVFGPRVVINTFNIEYNKLSFLHQEMMDKVSAENVLLWGNPWQCSCQKFINAWIVKNNKDIQLEITRDEDPSCVTALSFKDFCVPLFDDDLYETFLTTFQLIPFAFCPSDN